MGQSKFLSGGIRLATADIIERTFLCLLLVWFLVRMIPTLAIEPYNIYVLVSEVFTVLLIMLRKPGPMAPSIYVWVIAIVGTCAGMFVIANGNAVIPIPIGVTLMLCGLVISVAAKICLNRSFGIVAANRGVKSSGPYRFVRHPMYFGYATIQIGFLLLQFSTWNVVVYAIAWIALILRVKSEEEFLSQDVRYREYAAQVRYRLIPGVY